MLTYKLDLELNNFHQFVYRKFLCVNNTENGNGNPPSKKNGEKKTCINSANIPDFIILHVNKCLPSSKQSLQNRLSYLKQNNISHVSSKYFFQVLIKKKTFYLGTKLT